jgi:hypothetical protein
MYVSAAGLFPVAYAGGMLPNERTTPEQWQIIIWGFIAVLILIGVVGLWCSLQAPPELAEISISVRYRSVFALVVAGLIYGIKRLVEAWFA